MTLATLFFIFLSIMVAGMLMASLSMFFIARGFQRNSIDGWINSIKSTFILNAICAILTTIGGLGSFICGVIWIINAIKTP